MEDFSFRLDPVDPKRRPESDPDSGLLLHFRNRFVFRATFQCQQDIKFHGIVDGGEALASFRICVARFRTSPSLSVNRLRLTRSAAEVLVLAWDRSAENRNSESRCWVPATIASTTFGKSRPWLGSFSFKKV